MKRVVIPVADKEGESAKPSLSTPSKQTPVQYEEEDHGDYSGPRRILPEEVMGLIAPSLKIGTVGGVFGMFAGATAGIIRTSTPVTFSIFTGFQWFVLSSSFYGSRQLSLQYLKEKEEPSESEKVKASALAGAFAGTMGGLVRGPKNILPGALMFTLLGAGGQKAVNSYYRRQAENEKFKQEGKGFLASKWSPVTKLSDEDYEAILKEKLLQIEVEMSFIDEEINKVKAQAQAQQAAQKPSEKGEPPSA
ncbi:hypothetical protein V8F20_004449 [Naviculisporaceae sp. PSN 640]